MSPVPLLDRLESLAQLDTPLGIVHENPTVKDDTSQPTDGEMINLIDSLEQPPRMRMGDLEATDNAATVLVNLQHSQSILTQSVVYAQWTTEAKETVSMLKSMETRELIMALSVVSGYTTGVVDQASLIKVVLPPGSPISNLVDSMLRCRQKLCGWN